MCAGHNVATRLHRWADSPVVSQVVNAVAMSGGGIGISLDSVGSYDSVMVGQALDCMAVCS